MAAFLWEERKVGRDGYVQWDRGYYGVPWTWAGKRVKVRADQASVELWTEDSPIAVHPRVTKRTLEQFDFGFQPSIDERLVRELAGLSFVANAANVILLGPPGVGKTHLAVALGLRAIEHGYGVYFVRAHSFSRTSAGPRRRTVWSAA